MVSRASTTPAAPQRVPRRRQVQRRGDVVVQRVLACTLEELARVGFDRLSLPQVALRAGINKTSLYRRWPTPGALVAAALAHALGHDDDDVDTGTLEGDLVAYVQRAATWVRSPVGRGVMRTLLAHADSPELRALTTTLKRTHARGPAIVFRRAIARGELPPDADVELALLMIAGTLLQRTVVDDAPVGRAFVRRLASFVTRALLPAPTTASARSAVRRSRAPARR